MSLTLFFPLMSFCLCSCVCLFLLFFFCAKNISLMLAFAPSRVAGVREIESLDLCLFLNVPLPIRRPGWWCLPVVLTVQMLVCGCGGVSRRLDQKSAKSPPRCGKSTVMFFGMVCLQHPRPGRNAFFFFFPDGDYVSL